MKRRLEPRFSIELSAKRALELVMRIEEHAGISIWAWKMLQQTQYPIEVTGRSVKFVTLSPYDFGMTWYPTYSMYLNAGNLLEWSKENLDGQILKLCTRDDALYLRASYKDQPHGEMLMAGMAGMPVVTETDEGPKLDPHIYYLEHFGRGPLLTARYACLDSLVGLGMQTIFQLEDLS
jgi:hypothetical protein